MFRILSQFPLARNSPLRYNLGMSENETKGAEMTIEQAIAEARETMAIMITEDYPMYARQCQEELITALKAKAASRKIA